MTAVALSVAVVIVALVARDVALRWMAGKREIEALSVDLRQQLRTLGDGYSGLRESIRDLDKWRAAIGDARAEEEAATAALTKTVSTLKSTIDMREGMKRS